MTNAPRDYCDVLTCTEGRTLLEAHADGQAQFCGPGPEGYFLFREQLAPEETFATLVARYRRWFSPQQTFLLRPAQMEIRALCVDMDSTIVVEESLDELARLLGCYDEVARITEAAMSGRIDFAEAFSRRMQLVRGVSRHELCSLGERLHVYPGVNELIALCQQRGITVHLLSGGLLPLVERVASRLGIRHVLANDVDFHADRLSGQLRAPLVDGRAKAVYARSIKEEAGLSAGQLMVVGDGANDAWMMQEAELAIGFHPHRVLYDYITSINNSADHHLLQWFFS